MCRHIKNVEYIVKNAEIEKDRNESCGLFLSQEKNAKFPKKTLDISDAVCYNNNLRYKLK